MNHYKIRQSITDRSSISVNTYLKDISKYPILTPEQESVLIKQAQSGNKNSKDKLIQSNLRFVISIAKQYQNKGLDLSDLIEYGNIGLIKAVNKFDETRGFRFISYAVWWIRQSILQALSEQAQIIKYPINQIILLNKINQASNTFEQQFTRKPSYGELAEILDLTEDKIIETLNNFNSITSLDIPIDDESDDILSDTIASDDGTEIVYNNKALIADVQQLLTNLSENEKIVICQFFGIGCTAKYIEDIAFELNLTKERVRQIKDKAILKLRRIDGIEKFMKYLG